MRLTLVILTLNEIDGVRHIVPMIPRDAVDEIIAVDGGSTDGTREFFAEQGIRIVEQQSRGRGEAFRIAMQESNGDALIFFSPDGNESPADIPNFRPLLEQGYDMVIASRMMRGAHNEEDDQFLKPRKWANNIFNLLANLFFRRSGPWITDSINGFRAVTRDAFEKLKPDGAGYTIEYQTTIRAFKHRMRLAEFPTHEGARVGGETKASSIPTGLRFLRLLLWELFH
ncbi:MAG TPA: glycosyltransferase family 2 protein [Candidatus Peribacteraceae bacterium]|nr:glycosyltransferase family 2 protein [Candidatus Peribacteraceae bacterium]